MLAPKRMLKCLKKKKKEDKFDHQQQKRNTIRIDRTLDSRLMILLVIIRMLIIQYAFRCSGTVCVFLCRLCLSARCPGIDCLYFWLL